MALALGDAVIRGGAEINGKCSPTAAHKRDSEFRATKYVGNGHWQATNSKPKETK